MRCATRLVVLLVSPCNLVHEDISVSDSSSCCDCLCSHSADDGVIVGFTVSAERNSEKNILNVFTQLTIDFEW